MEQQEKERKLRLFIFTYNEADWTEDDEIAVLSYSVKEAIDEIMKRKVSGGLRGWQLASYNYLEAIGKFHELSEKDLNVKDYNKPFMIREKELAPGVVLVSNKGE